MSYRERRCALITVAAGLRSPISPLPVRHWSDSPWRAVHKDVLRASRCGGVAQTKAEVTFAAVYHFGPRWGTYQTQRPFQTDEDFRRIRDYVESNPDITLEEIENLDEAALRNFKRKRLR
jgi:hypothetical protein